MADEAATPGPAVDPPDPFAGAITTLRDTLKWLTTTFAGVIGLVIAGTSLTGITKLPAHDQLIALLGCGLGLLCIVAATGVMLHLLLPQTFYFGELLDTKNRNLLRRLNSHAIEFLPPEFESIEEFMKERDEAVQKMRVNRANLESAGYQEGAAFLDENFDAIARLAYLAHYELLRSNLRRRQWLLFVLAIFAIGGLGLFAVKVGSVKDSPPAKTPPVEAHLSLDLSPALLGLQQSATRNESLTLLLETAVDAAMTKDGSASGSKSLLGPLLDLVQSLADAGALPKDVAMKLRDELIKNSVEAGKEVLVDVAKKIIDGFFPPVRPAPVTVSVAGCCGSCATHPAKKPKAPTAPAASAKCNSTTITAPP
jgi:hypothetical protein